MNVDAGGAVAAGRGSVARQPSLFAGAQSVSQPGATINAPAVPPVVPDEASQLLFLKVATTRGYRHVERWFMDAVGRMRAEMQHHLRDLRDIDERQMPVAFHDVTKIRHEARNTRDALLGRIAEMHRVVRRERRAVTHWQAVFARLALAYTEDVQAAVRVLLDRRRKAEEWTVHGARGRVREVMERFEVKRAALRERAAREEARERQARAQERDRLRLAFESCMQELRNVVSWHLQAPNRGGKVGQLRRRQLLQILGPAVRGPTRRLLTTAVGDTHDDGDEAESETTDKGRGRDECEALLLPPTRAELALQAEERALCAQLRAHRRRRRRRNLHDNNNHHRTPAAKQAEDEAAVASTPGQWISKAEEAKEEEKKAKAHGGAVEVETRRVVLPALPQAARVRRPPEELPAVAGTTVDGATATPVIVATPGEESTPTPTLAPVAQLRRRLDAVEAALVPPSSVTKPHATQPCGTATTGHATAPAFSSRPAISPPSSSSSLRLSARSGEGGGVKDDTSQSLRLDGRSGTTKKGRGVVRPALSRTAALRRPANPRGAAPSWAASTTCAADILPRLGPNPGVAHTSRRPGRPASPIIVTPATAGGPSGQGFSTEHLMQLLHSLRGELSEGDAVAGRAEAEAAALLAELHRLRATTAARLLDNVRLERDAAALRRRRRERQSRAAALHAVVADNRLREALDWGVLRGEQVEVLAELRRRLAAEQSARQSLLDQVSLLDHSTQARERVLQAMQNYWRRHAAVMRRTSNAAAALLARAGPHAAPADNTITTTTMSNIFSNDDGDDNTNGGTTGGGIAMPPGQPMTLSGVSCDEPRGRSSRVATGATSSSSSSRATTAVLANYSAALAEMEAVTPIPVTSVFSNETPRDTGPQSVSMTPPGGTVEEDRRPFCAFSGGAADPPSTPPSPASATHVSSAMEPRAAEALSYPATLDATLQLREENVRSGDETQDQFAARDDDAEGEREMWSEVVAIPALRLYRADQVAEFIYSVFEGA